MKDPGRVLVAGLVLSVLTLSIYGTLRDAGFVNFDDDYHVTDNEAVKSGGSGGAVRWAFATFHAGSWMPVTWLSHMLDVRLYDLEPGGHHLTSLALHILNLGLTLLLLWRLTGAVWRSALAAALFAVHPLHVESVAWVSERKDVLSTFFWLLAVLAYLRRQRTGKGAWGTATAGCFALALMAKPMPVTLPFLLLLLDYWPLGRLGPASRRDPGRGGWASLPGLIREKRLLFAMAAAASLMTLVSQGRVGAVSGLAVLPVTARIANGLVAYWAYIGKTVWPDRLTVFYLYPLAGRAPWQAFASVAGLAAVTWAVLRGGRRPGYLAVGWFWFLGTLVPVLGLVQVGAQSMADRYTYVPLTGLFIMLSWGLAELAGRSPGRRASAAVLSLAAVAALSVVSARQAALWHDSSRLFEHALAINPDNYPIRLNYGVALLERGKEAEAEAQFRRVPVGEPHRARALFELSAAMERGGRDAEAMDYLVKALRADPNLPPALFRMGLRLAKGGKRGEAEDLYRRVLSRRPDFHQARNELGLLLADRGETREALEQFREALRLNPGNVLARLNMGSVLATSGNLPEAAEQFRTVLRMDPGNYRAHNNLGNVYYLEGRDREAEASFREALRLKPDYAMAARGLALVLERKPEP